MIIVPAAVLLLAMGPSRNIFQDGAAALRQQLMPTGEYIDHPSVTTTDKQPPDCNLALKPPSCALSDQLITDDPNLAFTVAPNDQTAAFTVTFGDDFDHPTPTDLFKIGFVNGVPKNAKQPAIAPKQVRLVAKGPDKPGSSTIVVRGDKTLDLKNSADFQSYLFEVDGVTTVDVYVLNPHGGNPFGASTINEIEFFKVG
jgi:hypothetical protein